MKHALQSIFLTALLLFVGQSLSADSFVVDGIYYQFADYYYDIWDEEDEYLYEEGPFVEVTYNIDDYYYSGEVIIPSEVTYEGKTYKVIGIGNHAFWGCYEMTSLVIPKSLKYIGDDAFNCMEQLTSVNIPEGVRYIGDQAFFECRSLTQVTISSTVKYIGRDAFLGCDELNSIVVNDGNKNYDSRDNCNALIETATNTLITGCKNTIIPTSVTTIGSHAFYGQYDLTDITLPEGLISIGEDAFEYCSLTSLTIPASLTDINPWSFFLCGQLKEIKVAAGNPKYDNRNDCNAIIETASNKLILGCETTVIPEDITTIGENAFAFSGFAGTTVPESVTSIEEWAFDGCKMKQFTIPSGMTQISASTFYGSDLQSIEIPENITYIGYNAFGACKLTEITIPETVPNIGTDILFNCDNLISAVISNSISTLNGTFRSCENLKYLSLGSGVKCIEDDAFKKCYSLSEFHVNAPVPPTCKDNVLAPINKETCILYVPEASIDAYRQAEGWKEFKHIEVYSASGIEQMATEAPASSDTYDIYGRQVSEPQPGTLYLRGNRKVLVR